MVERKYLFFKPMIFSISLNFSIIFSISLLQYNIIQYICHIIISHYRSFCWVEYKNKHALPASWKCNLSQLVTTCHCLRSPGCGQKAAGWFGEWVFDWLGHHGLNPFLQSLESGKPLFFLRREARNFSTHLRFGWYILVVTFLNHLVAVDGWYRWM